MHKRCIAGILLAALLVSLCGCTSVFDKEYLSVRPYEEPSMKDQRISEYILDRLQEGTLSVSQQH